MAYRSGALLSLNEAAAGGRRQRWNVSTTVEAGVNVRRANPAPLSSQRRRWNDMKDDGGRVHGHFLSRTPSGLQPEQYRDLLLETWRGLDWADMINSVEPAEDHGRAVAYLMKTRH